MISTVVAKGILFAFSTTYPEAKPPNRPTINASVCAVDRMSVEYNSVVCTQVVDDPAVPNAGNYSKKAGQRYLFVTRELVERLRAR